MEELGIAAYVVAGIALVVFGIVPLFYKYGEFNGLIQRGHSRPDALDAEQDQQEGN